MSILRQIRRILKPALPTLPPSLPDEPPERYNCKACFNRAASPDDIITIRGKPGLDVKDNRHSPTRRLAICVPCRQPPKGRTLLAVSQCMTDGYLRPKRAAALIKERQLKCEGTADQPDR